MHHALGLRYAADFGSRADCVGLMGISSGGHLALLNSLKPADPRYSAIRNPEVDGIDAAVSYLIALWPVTCPLQRHHYLQNEPGARDEGRPTKQTLEYEDTYWVTAERMAEGSPLLALERGDSVELPSLLYVQNEADKLHPAFLREQFVSQYANKGGRVQVELFSGERYDDPRTNPTLASATQVFDGIAGFIHDQTSRSAPIEP